MIVGREALDKDRLSSGFYNGEGGIATKPNYTLNPRGEEAFLNYIRENIINSQKAYFDITKSV